MAEASGIALLNALQSSSERIETIYQGRSYTRLAGAESLQLRAPPANLRTRHDLMIGEQSDRNAPRITQSWSGGALWKGGASAPMERALLGVLHTVFTGSDAGVAQPLQTTTVENYLGMCKRRELSAALSAIPDHDVQAAQLTPALEAIDAHCDEYQRLDTYCSIETLRSCVANLASGSSGYAYRPAISCWEKHCGAAL